MLAKVLIVCLLELIAARSVLDWNRASRVTFERIVNEEPLTLVAFVAPWTESSRALEAEWLAATSRTKTALLSIDCTVEADLCREQEVISYPTLRVFDGSKRLRRYKGSRKASAIVSFLNRATLPTISTLDSKNITDFKSADDAVVIAYIPDEQRALKSACIELAYRNHDKFTFGIVKDKSLTRTENVQVPSVVVHKSREAEQEVLPGPSGIDVLEKFLETATAPPIGEFTRRNELKYMKAGKSLVYYFAHNPQDLDNYREALKPLAKKFKEYLNFVTVDAVEYGHMLPVLGLKNSGFSALAVFNPMYGQAFPHDQKKEITPQVVESFVMDIVQGKVQPLDAGGGGENTKHTEL